MEQYNNKKFYDIHMHSFNLSHPSLSAFLKRFLMEYGYKIVLCFFLIIGLIYMLFKSWIATAILAVVLILVVTIIVKHAISPSDFSTHYYNLMVKLFKKPLNLLALMENDLGNYFLLTEDVLMTPKGSILINKKGLMVIGGQ